MFKFISMLLVALTVADVLHPAAAAATKEPTNSTYYNPILPGWHSDPSCINVNNTFYCAFSTFESFPGLPIYASSDLINWRHISNAWNREAQLPGINLQTPRQQDGFFAPNLRYHDGLFYLTNCYAGIDTASQINGTIFTTADPYDDEAWSLPFVWEGLERTIDPDLFWDDDGTAYLTWSGIVQQTINLTSGVLSEPVRIWNGSSGVWAEGPHIYKKDGYYYLLAAEGGTQLGHMATIARSRNISGPYVSNPNNPILSNVNTTGLFQTVGHADLFQDADGNWWGLALTTRSGPDYETFPMGREAALFPVTWDDGEWPVATQVEGTMNGWSLPQYDRSAEGLYVDEPDVIDFEPGTTLPKHFLHFRYPPPDTFTVSAPGHPNALKVRPSISNLTGLQNSSDPVLNGQAGIAYVGRRQTDSLFTFDIDLSRNLMMPGVEAGATMFFTQWQHLDVGIASRAAGQFDLILRSTNATSSTTTTPMPSSWQTMPDPSIRLTIQAVNTTHYQFSAAPVDDLNSKLVLGDLPATLVSSTWGEQAGSGAAVQVGIYATTNGQNMNRNGDNASDHVYFSRWRYQGRGQEIDFGTFV